MDLLVILALQLKRLQLIQRQIVIRRFDPGVRFRIKDQVRITARVTARVRVRIRVRARGLGSGLGLNPA